MKAYPICSSTHKRTNANKVSLQSWMTYIFCKPLLVFGTSMARYGPRISFPEFIMNMRGQAIPHNIVGVMPYDLGAVNLHATPRPFAKAKYFHVELIRKPFGPFRTLR